MDQVNFESIITPKNLIFSTFFKIMLFLVTDVYVVDFITEKSYTGFVFYSH